MMPLHSTHAADNLIIPFADGAQRLANQHLVQPTVITECAALVLAPIAPVPCAKTTDHMSRTWEGLLPRRSRMHSMLWMQLGMHGAQRAKGWQKTYLDAMYIIKSLVFLTHLTPPSRQAPSSEKLNAPRQEGGVDVYMFNLI